MAATRERKVPALVDKPMDFCPGCGHGIVSRLIMEALEELDQIMAMVVQMVVATLSASCMAISCGGVRRVYDCCRAV